MSDSRKNCVKIRNILLSSIFNRQRKKEHQEDHLYFYSAVKSSRLSFCKFLGQFWEIDQLLRPQESNKTANKMELGSNASMPAENGIDLNRISLRQFDLSDVDNFMAWACDEKVCGFCPWEPAMSKEEAMKLLQYRIFGPSWFKSICLDGKSIGDVTVTPNPRSSDRCRAEIGYALGSEHWNKGIATHVVKSVAETIFRELPELERLEAVVDVENVASQRVLEKAGFEREGVLKKFYIFKGKTRDIVMYSFIPNVSNHA